MVPGLATGCCGGQQPSKSCAPLWSLQLLTVVVVAVAVVSIVMFGILVHEFRNKKTHTVGQMRGDASKGRLASLPPMRTSLPSGDAVRALRLPPALKAILVITSVVGQSFPSAPRKRGPDGEADDEGVETPGHHRPKSHICSRNANPPGPRLHPRLFRNYLR